MNAFANKSEASLIKVTSYLDSPYMCHSGNSNPVPFLIPLVVVPIGTATSAASNWNYH